MPKEMLEIAEAEHIETFEKTDHLREVLIHLQYEGKASFGKNVRQAETLVEFFEEEVKGHMTEEEKTLFPFLETHIPKLGPLISLLRAEHQDFKKTLGCFRLLLERITGEKEELERRRLIEKLKETGTYLIYLLQGHLQQESEVLYRVAERELRPEEKRRLEKQVRSDSNPRRPR